MSVTSLPIWKRGATAAERFEELAQLAREKPERFAKVFVVYVELLPIPVGGEHSPTVTRYITAGVNTSEAIGLIELGKYHLLKYTHGG